MSNEGTKEQQYLGAFTKAIPVVATNINTRVKRKVSGDTPEHAKHLIWDSHSDLYAESNGGLAFSLGVACIEAETARDTTRFWKVCHQNGTELYHVAYMSSGQTIITKVY